MTGRALTPATRLCLGGPLPRQQADRPRGSLGAEGCPTFCPLKDVLLRGHRVLALVSQRYPRLRGKFLTCYSPVRRSVTRSIATPSPIARLACIKHAASVHPEPGSNPPSRSHPPVFSERRCRRTDRPQSLISYCKALLGCPLFCVVFDPRMLLRDSNLCMSLAMQFSRRRKNPDSIPECLVGGRLEGTVTVRLDGREIV